MKGRPPKPTALKLVTGTYQKCRANPAEATPARGELPTPPPWLGKGGRDVWRSLAPELHRVGLLTMVDRAQFAGYCALYARFIDAERAGEELKAPIMQQLRLYAGAFGLDPSSRARVPAAKGEEKTGNPWDSVK